MRTLIVRISITLALLYLVTVSVEGLSLEFRSNATAIDLFAVFKVGSIVMLLVLAARTNPISPMLLAALVFSAVGDFLLAAKQLGPLDEARLFLGGLAAFLAAHLCYFVLFLKNAGKAKLGQARRFSIVLVVAAMWFVLSRLWPSLGAMRIPVLLYAVALLTMAITAQFSRFPATVALGALSFVASDAMLAVSHFGHPFAASRPLIWATYYVAQFFLCVGILGASSPLFLNRNNAKQI